MYFLTGLFMGFVWLCLFMVILILYREPKQEPNKNADTAENTEMLLRVQEVATPVQPPTRSNNFKHFSRIEILVLLLTTFFTYFNQTSLETILIPFTEEKFGWNELHNSLLFCFGGIVIIGSYVLIRFLTMKFPDRFVLTTGVVLILSGLTIALISLHVLDSQAPVLAMATNRTG
jgi:predicted MFS family arabinose efflux permease